MVGRQPLGFGDAVEKVVGGQMPDRLRVPGRRQMQGDEDWDLWRDGVLKEVDAVHVNEIDGVRGQCAMEVGGVGARRNCSRSV